MHLQKTDLTASPSDEPGEGESPIDEGVQLEKLARTLESHPESYRVLRRLELQEGRRVVDSGEGGRVALALDVETTGLGEDDVLIEIAMRRIRMDRQGHITEIGQLYSWLEDPGRPLDPAVSVLTGLTDEDLHSRRIDDAAVLALASSVRFVTAFHAGFDCAFFRRRYPSTRELPWACGLKEIGWRRRGLDRCGLKLTSLLSQMRLFHGAHRAGGDVDALIALLGHVDDDGRTALAEMIENAERPTARFRAVGAHFDVKNTLKGRGYTWLCSEAVWSREVPEHAREEEAAWLAAEVYAPERRPKVDGPAVDGITWVNRHG